MQKVYKHSISLLLLVLLCVLGVGSSESGNGGSDTLYIPTDSKAKYTVIQNKKIGDLVILQTIRKSSYGVSFSTRLFNCRNATFKYLVDVEGEKNMNVFLEKNNEAMEFLDESNMNSLVRGSISHYAYQYACE